MQPTSPWSCSYEPVKDATAPAAVQAEADVDAPTITADEADTLSTRWSNDADACSQSGRHYCH